MSNFWQRLVTGIIFLAVLISCILLNQWTCAALFAIVDVLAMNEFYHISSKPGCKPLAIYGTATGLAAYILCFLSFAGIVGFASLVLIVPMLVPIFLIVLFGKFENPINTIAMTIYGLIYVALPFALIMPIAFHSGEYQSIMVLGMFIIIWVNDTGAYCFGVTIGRHHMFERISPKKTWEGLFGGIITSVGASLLLAHYFTILTDFQWVGLALLTITFGTFGDLAESQMKRTVGIKDSSNILPGHGGILDRFDSIMLAIPVIFAYLHFIS